MDDKKTKILAVTSCPFGISHTYIAAEKLKVAAEKYDCKIKVETRGSIGTENVITDSEIKDADFVIIAADTRVPIDRFHGKKLIEVPVKDGVNKSEELIERALAGDGEVFIAKYEKPAKSEEKKNVGHHIYKHLMTGVSYMLPFVVGGGLLVAFGYLIDSLAFDLNNIPDYLIQQFGSAEAVKDNFGSLTQASNFLQSIGNLAFGLVLPILAGFIALSIADRPALLVGIVGGLIASNGESGFLGAMAAGFIAGYITRFLIWAFKRLPNLLAGLKPVFIYPVLGILLIGIIMTLIIEPSVGMVNTALSDALVSMSGISSILLGFIIAGMMGIDMGGPFNKAAYLFGTASLASGNYTIMAAVMIGGMIPPCGIALAALLFKNKFTNNEKKSAPAAFIMGLSFITEGAIPYAAVDPLRVIPACIAGSAIAGAISMAFECTLIAPHGGIFVFPVVNNSPMYIVALAAGTIVTALMLGLLKKKIK
ncbi:MAG: fructose-specific PTS transporter subunit EIIC [Coriobacteriia bacterium]|nr:fructose-specific PTS transporter subunit EIIC [Coriobacteriia bacterium]